MDGEAWTGFLASAGYFSLAMHDLAKTKPKKARQKAARRPSVEETFEMVVHLRPVIRLTHRQLLDFCALNSELRIEQTAEGELIIMPPVSSEGSHKNFNLYQPFAVWAEKNGGGQFFDSSGGFRLPNKAMRSPDVSWATQGRLDVLGPKDRRGFMALCPDFVLELRSRSDRLPKLQAKMAEYIANGARLGWLIDPLKKQVFVYRPDAPFEHLQNPTTLSGDPVLAGFTLDLARVW